MTIQSREAKALEAYIKLMQNKGASAENLARRVTLLNKAIPLLAGVPADGSSYREIVDEVLLHVPRDKWPFFLAVTREYYYFWTGDFKAIAVLNSNGDFMMEPAAIQGEKTLKQAWDRLDNEKFDVAEMWPLQAYKAALREDGAEKSVVETREKLVKLLLIDLRKAGDKDGKNYRVAVDSLQSIFSLQETRRLFLTVVREFYYFWIGDPDAASRIVLDQLKD